MALDLQRIAKGLAIEADNFSSEVHILQGTGAPGGDAAAQDAAPIGSLFLRSDAETDALQLYWKWSTANSSSADWKQATNKEYVDAVASGLSWREPVRVQDATLYANATAFPVGGTVDGVLLSAGDRVLFSNVTLATDENVFIWDGATWTEDTNAETDGDAVLVQEGTYAEQQWVYDGTNWVQFGSGAGAAELGYIRTFIGKTGPGSELPTYSSTDIVTQSNSLEAAIGELDAAGGTQTYTEQNEVTTGEDFTTSIDALDVKVGNSTFTESNFVAGANDITENLDALDVAVQDNANQNLTINVANVTTQTVIDLIPVAGVDSGELVKWMIIVENTGDSTNRISGEILAMHDGAGNVDFTRYATLKLGANIAGLVFAVDVSAGNMRLLVTSTTAVDVGAKRLGFVNAN